MSSPIQSHFFRLDDELTFKRQYAIQFLAALDGARYNDSCNRGVESHCHSVETAMGMANTAWEEWKIMIGVIGGPHP